MSSPVILQADAVSKKFGGVRALEKVRFDLRSGEVHALVGENGAGKSTLIKIICGIYARDEGRITYRGREVHFKDNIEARLNGIGIVPQEIQLAPKLTVAENIFMGLYPKTKYGFIKWKQRSRGFPDFAMEYGNPDFVAYAESYGAAGMRLGRNDDLLALLKEAFALGRPVVVDCPVDYSVNYETFTRELDDIVC